MSECLASKFVGRSERRRWTLCDEGEHCPFWEVCDPGGTPPLTHGERVEVMPVAEHDRLRSALTRLAAWADNYDGDIAGALGDVLAGDYTGWEDE